MKLTKPRHKEELQIAYHCIEFQPKGTPMTRTSREKNLREGKSSKLTHSSQSTIINLLQRMELYSMKKDIGIPKQKMRNEVGSILHL